MFDSWDRMWAAPQIYFSRIEQLANHMVAVVVNFSFFVIVEFCIYTLGEVDSSPNVIKLHDWGTMVSIKLLENMHVQNTHQPKQILISKTFKNPITFIIIKIVSEESCVGLL